MAAKNVDKIGFETEVQIHKGFESNVHCIGGGSAEWWDVIANLVMGRNQHQIRLSTSIISPFVPTQSLKGTY